MTGPRDPRDWRDPLAGDDAGAEPGMGSLLGGEPAARRSRGRSGRAAPTGRARPGTVVAVLLGILAVLVVLVVVGVVAIGRLFGGGGTSDYAGGGNGTPVRVHVESGDSTTTIANALAAADVVKSAGAFTDAAADDPRSTGLQPGYYQLQGEMSGKSALALMLDPKARLKSVVTIPEGSSLQRTLDLIGSKTEVPRADLTEAAANPATLGLDPIAKNHVEGFLFPATYDIEPGTDATAALQQLARRFTVAADDVQLEAGAKALGRTPYEVVVVASLIEREAANPADRPKVASVIYNRLEAGQMLGLESTERFALGNVAGELTQSQLDKAYASPYDTYRHVGLPPAPIDNPGQAALEAALHPTAGNLLYFVTLPKTHTTEFVETEAQFDELTARCRAQGGCGG